MTGTSHATWRSVGLEASAKIIGELKADSGAVCLYKNGNGGTVDIADKSGTLGPMQWWRMASDATVVVVCSEAAAAPNDGG